MCSASAFDPDLIRRYDRAVPRYTSYPSAPYFTADFSRGALESALADSAATNAPVSLYVHIPFCESPCFYCGCNKIITRRHAVAEPYLDRLDRELALRASSPPQRRRVAQLHFGGGTPTFLSSSQLARLVDQLARHYDFDLASDREYSIEIDPRTVADDTIVTLATLGFNRISLGVQDFDPLVQEAINRIQPYRMTADALAQAREHGLATSCDLICGLPLQTTARFDRTLRDLIGLRPDRVSIYSYAHLPGMFKAQRRLDRYPIPDAEARIAMMQCAVQRLGEAGYLHIGMDHFALPDDPLSRALRDGHLQRNFQGYSTHGGLDLFAYGVSAISRIGACHVQNAKTLGTYAARIDAGRLPYERGYVCSADDLLRGAVIEALMCQGRVAIGDIEARFGIDFWTCFVDERKELSPMIGDGLLAIGDKHIRLSEQGRFLVRVVASVFDAHRRRAEAGAPAARAI